MSQREWKMIAGRVQRMRPLRPRMGWRGDGVMLFGVAVKNMAAMDFVKQSPDYDKEKVGVSHLVGLCCDETVALMSIV